MTAGDDGPGPSRIIVVALLIAVTLVAAACTSGTAEPESGRAGPLAAQTRGAVEAVPESDELAIRSTIDRLNNAAGAVPDQQALLTAVVDPGLAGSLEQCAPATTTLRFQPIYQALRPSPDWSPVGGTPSGTVYALPSLIRIYTGDRITGTDLTTLHLGVTAGEVFLTPLCVG